MASLRSASAARLLRAAAPRTAPVSMAQRRFKTTDVDRTGATSMAGNTEVANHVPAVPQERLPNSPDYGVHTDKATSTFTPVPKRVMDGSEDVDSLPAAVLSGAPIELQARTVRIYKQAKPATQSGSWGAHHWRMDWDVLAKGHRWENPLMGWQSSGDFMQGTKIEFKTKEDAIAFAEKQGYEYFVQEPKERVISPKAYANNFLYSPGKLKHIRTK
ncbi:ETC complex I subunit conserved region-domain-containing protein [Microdochium trichocladiopsis]|uniref:NADH dehydrogenase [ubiquinone] iron-sulfur protein 4, mitochondrial n=1 Tax=Microdochium trichocladiopsis TaxID=1682393 RepID=A0A9P8YCQ9_9PEZI|nr:ETC complex I subunit conserved region-domain-containing protein [Microdochium trichocladiopsis]KAH7035649.1 ETC complex I subunit conserved region-domain-containing protein [Microdochium trichocladiopsis]